ncbi:MAG: histidine kinase [Actinomycetota bacterium]|nr:histidine kinase [Actinomycetota bacterium]
MIRRSRLAFGLWVIVVLLEAPGAILGLQNPTWPLVFVLLGVFSYPALGAFLAARRPDNPLGWLLLAGAVVTSYVGFAYTYGLYPDQTSALPGAIPVIASGLALSEVPWAILIFILLLFPEGRLPSRRWRPYVWITVALSVWFFVIVLTTLEATYGTDIAARIAGRYYGLDSPVGAATLVAERLFRFLLLFAPLALVARYRRAPREERLQIKWVAITAPPLVLVGAGLTLLNDAVPLPRWLGMIMTPLVLWAFTGAIVVSVLKYRLYDIDVIVNKALVYAGLAGFVTVLYVGIVVGIGQLIGSSGEPNLVLSVAATAAVAVAFHPVRDRLQRLANRLVYGQRSTPYEVMADLARRLSGAYSVDEVLPRMAEAAARGVGAEQARVRVLLPSGRERSVRWPEDAPVDNFDRVLVVTHRDEPVGEIAVAKPRGDRVTPAEDKLLADLAAQAGPALRNVALVVEREDRLRDLAAQAEELRTSRNRIVRAQDTERRRLERDLHDGAQQQLVSLAGQLRLAKRMTTKDVDRAASLLDALVVEADEALAGVRDLARGIFPPLLADQGLPAALDARISKYCPEAKLACDGELRRERLDARVEENVYFCCIEALQNAAKHAPGAPVEVRLQRRRDELVFSVADEGPGFDTETARSGGGLENMADRMAALGGDIVVESCPGSGTIVAGSVPLHLDDVPEPLLDLDVESRKQTTEGGLKL